jgi:tetratricopeptide (TPR) repeat protein
MLGQRERAIQDLDQALRLSRNATTYRVRAQVHADLGQRERAIEDYAQAIGIDPKDAAAYYARGRLQAALGRREPAVRDFDEMLALAPDRVDDLNGACYALAAAGFAAQALRYCDASLQRRPNHGPTLDSRAYAHLRLDRLDEALRDYDAAITADARIAIAWYGRAIVRARRGDRAGADADLAEARRLVDDIDARAARVSLAMPPPDPSPATQGPAVAAPQTAPPSDPAMRLRQLRSLLEEGLISQAEYDDRRQRILDGL